MKRQRKSGVFAKLKIAGYKVEVRWTRDLVERTDCAGLWHPDKRLIELDAGLSDIEAQETLIHECAHAASDIRGLNLSEGQVRHLGLDLQQMLAPYLREIR